MTTLAGTPCLNSAPATPPQQTDVPNADIAEHLQPATRDCLPMSNVGRTAAPSAGFEKSGEPPEPPPPARTEIPERRILQKQE